jgi:hypothetical protein
MKQITQMGKFNTAWVRRLYFNIVSGRFKWEKYVNDTLPYFGLYIRTEALYSDTSQRNMCGFNLYFPYNNYPNIAYDWDLDIFQVNGQKIKFNLLTKEVIWLD